MKKIIILTTMLTLTACAASPPQTLDQRLQGKSAEDRKEELRLACLNEAEWSYHHSSLYRSANQKIRDQIKFYPNEEVSETKALCEEMNEAKPADKKVLAQKCQEHIDADLAKYTVAKYGNEAAEHAAEHAKRMQKICAYMTGGVDGK